MIKFDSRIMTKCKIKEPFTFEDDNGVAVVRDIDDLGNIDGVAAMYKGTKCWVFHTVNAIDSHSGQMLFAYFPELDVASTILASYVEIE